MQKQGMKRFILDSQKLHYHPRAVADFLEGKDIYPLYAEISPTAFCNHRCLFCNFNYLGHKGKFPENRMIYLVKELAEAGLKSLVFAGSGEPTMHPDTLPAIETARKAGVDVAMSTNGALLKDESIEIAVKNLTWIRFSFSGGSPENYARIHQTKESDYKLVLSNIEKMSSFGESGKVFLIEEGLQGEEFSYYAMSDGKAYITFKSAQDNKPALTFDEGDQTGGMGAISPAIVTTPFTRNIEERFIARAINGMRNEGINYIGMLYLGGMVVKEQPVCIEYNSRWGDPECQAVLPSLKTDYLTLIKACLQGKLASINIEQDAKSRVCVVGASRGYPDDYSQVTGKSIHGLEGVLKMEGINL